MRRFTMLLCLATVLLAPAIRAQDVETTVPACPSTATLDLLIKAIDAAVSGPVNKDRACFRALFMPETRLIPLRHMPDGSYQPHVLTVDDWISLVAKRGSDSLTEKQIRVGTETYGHLAHLWSTYETASANDKRTDRGINSIQAVFDGKVWKIIEIVWQAESATEKVPEKYLP
ncbi:MAG TPA: hypothetical protein VGI45_17905 [Terracidiphilus sp.]|jgi:hypothetical protein